MPAESAPATEPLEDTSDSRAYTWTIRALYAGVLGMNIYILWQASKDDADLAILRAKAEALFHRAVAPVRRQREWQKNLGRMWWGVHEALEETNADG